MTLRYSIDPADTDGGMAAAAVDRETTTISPAILEAALTAAIKESTALASELAEEREWSVAKDDQTDRLVAEAEEDRARAEKAEEERDKARTDATYWENTSKALTGALERSQARAEQPRPLAPEDVTRALNAAARSWFESTPPEDEPHDTWKVKQATWAALRDLGLIPEPPTRDPESEKIEEKVATAAREAGLHLDVEDARKIADSLAAQGVRAES